MNKLLKQIFSFGIVGVICFLIDYLLMILLTELIHIPYLISCGISFVVSTIANYYMSMHYVFQSKKDINKVYEFTLFVVLSTIGLGLTELLMYFMTDKMHVYYMISKIAVTGIVMVYNFVTRKLLLEQKSDS